MRTRRGFLKVSGTVTLGTLFFSSCTETEKRKSKNIGIQLYSVRKEMLADPVGTLKKLAQIGYKELESARSDKGNYYGLKPKEIKKIVTGLGMNLRSGHVHIDDQWQQSIDAAAETGQEYIICSTLPTTGQTVENYRKVADAFSKAGEECKKANLLFGYHNHDYEFEKENGEVLYDVLLKNTDSSLVHMELDLGWVVASGNNPIDYFEKYKGRFPLWHLKDMDMAKKQSTEFGKGGLDIKKMFDHSSQSGLKYFFIEQEEYSSSPLESMKHNMDYLKKMNS